MDNGERLLSVQIVLADTPHNFNNRNFITLESITFCPKQTKLIDRKLLTREEVQYIDDYHRKCWEVVSPLLEKRGQPEALEWLRRETQPIGA